MNPSDDMPRPSGGARVEPDAPDQERRHVRSRHRQFGHRRNRRRTGWVMSLNLTPMIDTVFNLLFLFMIISRFGAIEGLLPARLPARVAQAGTVASEVPRTPIRVRLVGSTTTAGMCRVMIDRFGEQPMPISSLAAILDHIREHEPGFDANTPLHLIAPDDVAWDHVVNVYNAAMAAQYEKIYFVRSP